jgi:FtsZ-binding cell division protein ZapB
MSFLSNLSENASYSLNKVIEFFLGWLPPFKQKKIECSATLDKVTRLENEIEELREKNKDLTDNHTNEIKDLNEKIQQLSEDNSNYFNQIFDLRKKYKDTPFTK